MQVCNTVLLQKDSEANYKLPPYKSNHFDDRLNDLARIVETLISDKGVFNINIHFSSSQLVCWTYDNPYSFQVYSAEQVFADEFMCRFTPMHSKIFSCINKKMISPILKSLLSLRQQDTSGSELRNASIHMLNGYIGLTFACDDTRYINYKDFIMPLTLKFSA